MWGSHTGIGTQWGDRLLCIPLGCSSESMQEMRGEIRDVTHNRCAFLVLLLPSPLSSLATLIPARTKGSGPLGLLLAPFTGYLTTQLFAVSIQQIFIEYLLYTRNQARHRPFRSDLVSLRSSPAMAQSLMDSFETPYCSPL